MQKRDSSKEFITDSQEVMNSVRMIEHHRDEEVCQRWDVLADEDHTYHIEKRFDFKQALSFLERLHQEAGEGPFVPTYSHTHKQWQSASSSFLHGGNGKVLSCLLTIQKVKEEASQVLGMNGKIRYKKYFGEDLRR